MFPESKGKRSAEVDSLVRLRPALAFKLKKAVSQQEEIIFSTKYFYHYPSIITMS